jgi:hypothetical protein
VAKRLKAAREAFVDVVDFVAGNTKAAPTPCSQAACLTSCWPATWWRAGNWRARCWWRRRAGKAGEDAGLHERQDHHRALLCDHILSKAPGIRDSIVEGADSVTALALEAF